MVLFSLGEINKNIPGNFERSLTSPGGGGVNPNMGYIGMCGPKG